jgi:hypothetical protein
MFLRKAVALASLEAVELLVQSSVVEGIAVDGPFLAVTIEPTDLKDRLAVVDAMDAAIGAVIAEAAGAGNDEDVAKLTSLKRDIYDLRSDVTRESYIQEAPVADATDATSISHPTSTGDASSSLSSQQHGADSEEKEETEIEQASEEERNPRRRQRR